MRGLLDQPLAFRVDLFRIMTEPYPDSSSDEGEKEDVIGQGLHGSIDSRVTIDSWQNQRYKPLQGGWCKPFTDIGVPYFSDLSGLREIASTKRDTGEEVPEVKLKEGWSFLDEWKVDKSGSFGRMQMVGLMRLLSKLYLSKQRKNFTRGDGAYESCTSQALGASENLYRRCH